jgi:DNA transformation protein
MDFAGIREMFSVFGAVDVRRMFGGAGIYADGTMFAILADGVIYLKADDGNTASFDRENLGPFTYATKDGKRGVMSYRRMPDRLYDDPQALAIWAREALAAARRRKKPKVSAVSSVKKSSGPLPKAAVRKSAGKHRSKIK